MPHPKFCVPSIIFLIALARTPAEGQTISSPYSFIEHSKEWAISVGKSDLNPGQLGLGPRDAATASGHFGVAFGGAMSFDVDATMFLSTRDILDVTRPVDVRSIGRTDFNILLTDFKLRLNLTGQRTWHGFQPFVIFGGGLALAASDRFDGSKVIATGALQIARIGAVAVSLPDGTVLITGGGNLAGEIYQPK